MTTGALIFMMLSWAFVLGLTTWAFGRILRSGTKRQRGDVAPPSAPPER